MGLKNSKSGEKTREEDDTGDTDDESEVLEIMQEGDVSEEGNETQEGIVGKVRLVCKKISRHHKFIPIKELNLSHLKEAIRHESVLEYIQLRAKLVVKISVPWTSMDRPDDKSEKFADSRGKNIRRVATGYAWVYCQDQSQIKCPDPCCAEDPNPHFAYRGILITTNRHVIYNNEEAKAATVEFFYDGDDKDSMSQTVTGRGYSLKEELQMKDYVSLKVCYHSAALFHQINEVNKKIMETWEKIPDEVQLQLQKHAIVISHPHGYSKRVSIGKLCDVEVLEEDKNRKETRYTCQTCEGSSGAPVLTGLYWTKPFVHSSSARGEKAEKYIGLSFTY